MFREFPKCQCDRITQIGWTLRRDNLSTRQSRLCRLLGNPVAFAVVALLTNGKDLSTSNGLCGSILADFDLNARTRGFFRRF